MNKQKWLSVIGAIVLLGSWTIEKTLLDSWESREHSLQNAEMVYSIFLASSLTMNAIPKSDGFFNEMNFRTGLNNMTHAFPDDVAEKWNSRIAASTDLNKIGIELMSAVEQEEKLIQRGKSLSRWIFMALYLFGSILIFLPDLYSREKPSKTSV
jgi:hypothetical protein